MGDVIALFREAFFRYNSDNPLQPKACLRFATRSMLLLADYSRQHGLYAEAHSALMKAHSQVSPHASPVYLCPAEPGLCTLALLSLLRCDQAHCLSQH